MRTLSLHLLAPLAALAGCPRPPAPPDARDALADASPPDATALDAPDAPIDPGPPATLRAADDRGALTLTAAPPRVELRAPDARVLLRSPEGGPAWIELGVRPGGASPNRFHDPRVPNPPGISWRAPAQVASADTDGGTSAQLDDPVAGPARVSVATTAPGVYRVEIRTSGPDVAMVRLNMDPGPGALYGLGERFAGAEVRGARVPMQLHIGGTSSGTNENHVPVPFFVSTEGYGVFVASRAPGAFDMGATTPGRVTATFEARELDVYLFAQPDPTAVIAAYTRASGLPRLPPRWAFAPMQWRNEWRNREELFADAQRLRAEGIPTTTIWIDNPWQRSYNDSEFDTRRFPDPPGIFRELARLGYRVLLWSTPYLDAVDPGATPANTAEQLYEQARAAGHLVRTADGAPYISPASPGARGGMVDFTSPAASAFWSARLDPLVALGARAFKLDYGEDVLVELAGGRPGLRFANDRAEHEVFSVYPQRYHAAYRAALDRGAGDDGGFLLVRASSWGGQSVADVVWPGDLDNDFRRAEGTEVGGLPAAVHALVSLAASGFPSFASDTGGYRGGVPTREVLLRWAEHTALSPFMQLGGGGESHNPWQYDPEAVAIYRELARLHNDLVPYLRVHALAASRDGTPPVRAAGLAFPREASVRADPYAYVLGDALFVAPVVTAGAAQREVHLPPGAWVHWFDRTLHAGPVAVTVGAPLGRPPLFVRRGAIVPLLADDVATLAPTDEPTIVDASDRRAVTRARVVPAGPATITLEDAARIDVDEAAATGVSLAFTPGREVTELRAEIDWRNRGAGGATAVTAVERDDGGPALTAAPDGATVARGCDGCWHYDAARGVLAVTVRGAARLRAR